MIVECGEVVVVMVVMVIYTNLFTHIHTHICIHSVRKLCLGMQMNAHRTVMVPPGYNEEKVCV